MGTGTAKVGRGRSAHSPGTRGRLWGGGDLSWPWSNEQDLEREEEKEDGGHRTQ